MVCLQAEYIFMLISRPPFLIIHILNTYFSFEIEELQMKQSVKVTSLMLKSQYRHFKMVPYKKGNFKSANVMKDKFCSRMTLLPLDTGVDKPHHLNSQCQSECLSDTD